jgi:triacylglycerol lipase
MSLSHVALFGWMLFALALPSWAGAEDRLPVIFAPGLGTTGDTYRNYSPLPELFKEHGYELKIADTAAYGTIEARTKSFVDSVTKLLPTGRFHIVSHSTGGVDARLAIYQAAFGSRVVSLTTLAAPHRGTSLAVWLQTYLHAHPSSLVPDGLMSSLPDLAPASMAQFNARVVDNPDVKYFSMGFYIPSGPILFYTFNPLVGLGHGLIEDAGEGDNDGIVSVESARWGTSLGEVPADHFSETMDISFAFTFPVRKIFERVFDNLDHL